MARYKVPYTRYILCEVEGHVVVEAETEEDAGIRACLGAIIEDVEYEGVNDASSDDPTLLERRIEYAEAELMEEEQNG